MSLEHLNADEHDAGHQVRLQIGRAHSRRRLAAFDVGAYCAIVLLKREFIRPYARSMCQAFVIFVHRCERYKSMPDTGVGSRHLQQHSTPEVAFDEPGEVFRRALLEVAERSVFML